MYAHVPQVALFFSSLTSLTILTSLTSTCVPQVTLFFLFSRTAAGTWADVGEVELSERLIRPTDLQSVEAMQSEERKRAQRLRMAYKQNSAV